MSEAETTTQETEVQEAAAAAEGNEHLAEPATAPEVEASGSSAESGQDASADQGGTTGDDSDSGCGDDDDSDDDDSDGDDE